MRYEKGTFVIVPNVEYFKGKRPELLAVYFWLCTHADSQGLCFPSRPKIAEESGIKSLRTVDKYIKVLVDDGIITKTGRGKTSNLYQLMVVQELHGEQQMHVNGATDDTTPRATDDTLTIPIINYTHPTIIVASNEEEFSFSKELIKLQESNRKDFKIIAQYLHHKGFEFENKEQFIAEFKRDLVPASKLKGYSGPQIALAIEFCKKNFEMWTLDTVQKRIADIINSQT